MKTLSTLGILLFVTISAMAQNLTSDRRTIEVTGEAETEVVPDRIYLLVTLKEYKNGSKKVSINTLEKQLVNAVKKLGLPEENLTVNNIYGYNWNWKKRKADDFLATKSFKLQMPNVKKINSLVEMLDEEGVNSMNIGEYDHSDIEKIRNDLKVKAIKAAREKARVLLAAIDEKLGKAVYVSENDRPEILPSPYRGRAFESASFSNDEVDYTSDLEFKKIKLQTKIRVIFEID